MRPFSLGIIIRPLRECGPWIRRSLFGLHLELGLILKQLLICLLLLFGPLREWPWNFLLFLFYLYFFQLLDYVIFKVTGELNLSWDPQATHPVNWSVELKSKGNALTLTNVGQVVFLFGLSCLCDSIVIYFENFFKQQYHIKFQIYCSIFTS